MNLVFVEFGVVILVRLLMRVLNDPYKRDDGSLVVTAWEYCGGGSSEGLRGTDVSCDVGMEPEARDVRELR